STLISVFNSLTLSPALCALLFKGHGGGHEAGHEGHAHKEALPRLGLVVIGGLLGYFWLAPLLLRWMGLEVGGHGEHATPGPVNPATLWGVRAGACVVGAVAGLFLAGPVNYVLGAFFAGFNWVFDRAINGYGRLVGALLRVSFIML